MLMVYMILMYMSKEKRGWVYFALAHADRPFVKIGFTWLCPWARVKDLAVSCPLPLSLIGIVEGPISDEAKLHQRYSMYHVRGEWFRFEYGLIELLNRLPAPDPVAFHKEPAPSRMASSCGLCRRRAVAFRAVA